MTDYVAWGKVPQGGGSGENSDYLKASLQFFALLVLDFLWIQV